jgi:2'-5' RNA ligase
LDGLVNHWVPMPEWRPGRRLWAFYLTFAGQPELYARVARYRELLRDVPGLDWIEPRWLHLTVQGIAFDDELDPARVDAIGKEIGELAGRYRLPTLTVGRARPDHDAISMPVTPTEELRALRSAIRAAVGAPLYQLPEPAEGFTPHISIAYAHAPVAGLGARLAGIGAPELRLDVPGISLLRLAREQPRWHWEDEQVLRFG